MDSASESPTRSRCTQGQGSTEETVVFHIYTYKSPTGSHDSAVVLHSLGCWWDWTPFRNCLHCTPLPQTCILPKTASNCQDGKRILFFPQTTCDHEAIGLILLCILFNDPCIAGHFLKQVMQYYSPPVTGSFCLPGSQQYSSQWVMTGTIQSLHISNSKVSTL